MSNAGTCTATKKDGAKCSGKAIGSTGLCLAHQPRAAKAPPAERINSAVSQGAAMASSSGVDQAAQKRLHAALVGVVGLCCVLLPYNYRPAQHELESFLLPLERIWLRHQPGVGDINEDITDALAAAVVAANYAMRVYIVPKLLSKPAAVPAGYDATADRAAAEPARSFAAPAASPANGVGSAPIGSDERTLEAMLSRAHLSSLHAGAGRGGDDPDDAEDGA